MSFKQEPLIFKYIDEPNPRITLLINPETLTIPWKKIINRVRTKSRIVSFYYGQEPINLAYTGQTGSLIPDRATISKQVNSLNRGNQLNQIAVSDVLTTLYNQRDLKTDEFHTKFVLGEFTGDIEAELNDINASIKSAEESLQQFEQAIVSHDGLITTQTLLDSFGEITNTELLKLSPKYQRFNELRQFYDESNDTNRLVQILYRHWIFDGYFETFSFVDDAKSPWNWRYSFNFIILNWQETGDNNKEQKMVAVEGFVDTVAIRKTEKSVEKKKGKVVTKKPKSPGTGEIKPQGIQGDASKHFPTHFDPDKRHESVFANRTGLKPRR